MLPFTMFSIVSCLLTSTESDRLLNQNDFIYSVLGQPLVFQHFLVLLVCLGFASFSTKFF